MNQEKELLEKVKKQVAKEQTWNGCPPWRRYPKEFEIMTDEVAERFANELLKLRLGEVRDTVERLREWINGREGCTWGDTDHDSISVAFGQELEIDQCLEIINKRIEEL